MVNCKNCGAPLSLEEAYCPHCGTPNPEAQEHLKKLSQLDQAFKKAQFEVKSEVSKSKSGYRVLVILAMVLAVNLLLFPFHEQSYKIADKILEHKTSKKVILSTMNDLLEQGEYIEMGVYADKFDLSYHEFGSYTSFSNLTYDYRSLIENMTIYLYGKDPYDDPLVRSCQRIKDFKADYAWYLRSVEDEKMKAYAKDLNDEFDAFLKVYLHLTQEDIDQIEDMSDSALLLRISERMNDEEE